MSTAVTGSFAATGQSSSLQIFRTGKTEERQAHVYLAGVGVGVVQLERQPQGDANWYPILLGGVQAYLYSYNGSPISEDFSEPVDGTLYRLNCTAFTSGPINWRLEQ